MLAQHQISVQLAKVSTLGERVEDTFLVDGPELQAVQREMAAPMAAARLRMFPRPAPAVTEAVSKPPPSSPTR